MGEIESRFGHLLSIWWLITWRSAAIAVVIVIPLSILAGVIFYLLGFPDLNSIPVRASQQIVSVTLGAAVGFLVDGMALRKRYLDFRIALLPHGADGPELAVTPRRVRSFWWLFLWRGWAGGTVIAIVIGGGLAIALRGATPQSLLLALTVTILPLIIIWSFMVLRMGLKKHYREFRIALIPEPRPADDTRGPG